MNNGYLFITFFWIVFGIQHSLLARPNTKKIIEILFGKYFQAHFYPFIYFISQCIIFMILWDTCSRIATPIVIYEYQDLSLVILYWANKFSNLFLISTVFHFDIGTFTGISQLSKFFLRPLHKEIKYQKLNNKYLYGYIRHPMYLGIILVYLTASPVITDIFILQFILILLYIEIGSYFEEKSLIRSFGNEYVQYQKSTYKYLPGIR